MSEITDPRREPKHSGVEYVTWTPAEDANLTARWAAGETAASIGREMSRTKSAVIGRVHRLSLPKRPRPIIRDGQPKPARAVGLIPRAVFHPRSRGVPGGALSPRRSPVNLAPVLPVNGGAGVSSEHIKSNMCQFPISADAPYRFCGRAPVAGRPYCEGHAARAYTTWIPKATPDDFVLRDRRTA